MNAPSTLLEYLVVAERIVVFTGAGISTGAGIPDYRGPNGVWKTRPEVYIDDYMDDPKIRLDYWRWKAEDWARWRDVSPTPAHHALFRLHQLGKLHALLTQNIDGLDRRAGIPDDKRIELHGRIDEVECSACGFRGPADDWYPLPTDSGRVPYCPRCDQFLKPGVIMFGQNLREEDTLRAQAAMQNPDLVIAIGSTLQVHPAATFPLMAARSGIPYIILNRGPTAHDGLPHVALRLEGDVQELFPAAVEEAAAMFG